MKTYKRFWRLFFLTAAAAIFTGAATADETAPPEPKAGSDYILVEPPQPMRVATGKLEIREFFNFSCPHCFRLQGPFARWRNESDLSDVVVIHQPVVFERYRGHYARAYYTMEALGLAKEYYGKMFTAIHRNRKLLNSKGRFINWLEEEAGADADTAEKVYDSFTVNTKTARAAEAAAVYGIDSTPQFVVAGKYILNLSISGSYDRLFATLDALLEKERQALSP